MEELNARILRTMLGTENRGVLSISVVLEFGIGQQSFGDYALGWGERMLVWTREMLAVGAVSKWEDLPGQHVRVRRDEGMIVGLGHITKDIWFIPAEDLPKDEAALAAYEARKAAKNGAPEMPPDHDEAPPSDESAILNSHSAIDDPKGSQ